MEKFGKNIKILELIVKEGFYQISLFEIFLF